MISLENKTFIIDSVARDYPFYNSVNGEKSGKTLFGIRFDGKNFYFRFDCEEEFFCPRYFDYNDPLYEGDIVELMISLGKKNRYLEVEVNQNNANYCVIIINADGKGKISIEKLKKNIINSYVTLANNKWVCDIIIPIKELKALGAEEDEIFFNAHRQDFDENGKLRLYSLSPARSETFHVTDAFLKAEIKRGGPQ